MAYMFDEDKSKLKICTIERTINATPNTESVLTVEGSEIESEWGISIYYNTQVIGLVSTIKEGDFEYTPANDVTVELYDDYLEIHVKNKTQITQAFKVKLTLLEIKD